MAQAATNESPAHVEASPFGGGGDPFALRKTMRSFRFKYLENVGRVIQLDLVAPNAATEQSFLDEFAKSRSKKQTYQFRFGWVHGGGKSRKIYGQLRKADYAFSLGQEVVFKLEFATFPEEKALNSASLTIKKTKSVVVANETLLKGRLGNAYVRALSRVIKIPGVTTVVYAKDAAEAINDAVKEVKQAIKKGQKAQEGGGGGGGDSDGAPQSTTYKDTEVGNMDDDYATKTAIDEVVSEAPGVEVNSSKGSVGSASEESFFDLYSLWGDKRDAIDDPWSSDFRDYDDAPDPSRGGRGGLGATFQGDVDNFRKLLENPDALEALPTHVENFTPSVDGPSEYVLRLHHLRNSFLNTISFPSWAEERMGRVEFWKGGEFVQEVPGVDRLDLRQWARDEDGQWDWTKPTISFIRKNLSSLGTLQNGFSSSMFEIPPIVGGPTDGVYMFRLSNAAVQLILVELATIQGKLEEIDDSGMSEFQFNKSRTGLSENGDSYADDYSFLYSDNPFDQPQAYGVEGGKGGGGGSGGGSSSPPKLAMSVKENESVVGFVVKCIGWINGFIEEPDDKLKWMFLLGSDIQGALKKVVPNAQDRKKYFIIAPIKVFKASFTTIKSFGWVGNDPLRIDVGGWKSLAAGLNVKVGSVLPATYGKPKVQGQIRSSDEALSGKGGSHALQTYEKIISVQEVQDKLKDKGGEEAAKGAAKDTMQDTNKQAIIDGEEVEAAEETQQSETPKTDEYRGKREDSKSVLSEAVWRANLNFVGGFQVSVDLVGIPEIDSVLEQHRKVQLNIQDIRGGSKKHGASGKYLITGFEHTINAEVGFTTRLHLRALENESLSNANADDSSELDGTFGWLADQRREQDGKTGYGYGRNPDGSRVRV